MVIDLHTALEAVESYFNDDTKDNVTLGGMAGVQLFKHIFDLSLGYFRFNDILLIEGCQDYIGMSKPSPVNNHLFYASLMNKLPSPSLFNTVDRPFSFNILNNGNPVTEYHCKMDIQRINGFKLIIVCDAHLIPPKYLNELKRYVSGKLIMLVDPFTVYGLAYTQVPTVVYSCFECDSLTAMARNIYGVDTDRVKQGKMFEVVKGVGPKTMTKLSNVQYATNDRSYLEDMQDKQISMGLKKGYRVMVTGNQVMTYKLDKPIEEITDEVTICENSLITIDRQRAFTTSTQGCILNSYPSSFSAPLQYETDTNPFIIDNTIVKVKPANILDVNSIGYHRFDKLIFINSLCSRKLTNAELYTLMTSTKYLAVTED